LFKRGGKLENILYWRYAAIGLLVTTLLLGVLSAWMRKVARLGRQRVAELGRQFYKKSTSLKMNAEMIAGISVYFMPSWLLVTCVSVGLGLGIRAQSQGLPPGQESILEGLAELLSFLEVAFEFAVVIYFLGSMSWQDVLLGLKIVGGLTLLVVVLPPVVLYLVFLATRQLARLHQWISGVTWVDSKYYRSGYTFFGLLGLTSGISAIVLFGVTAVWMSTHPAPLIAVVETQTPAPTPTLTPLQTAVAGGPEVVGETTWTLELEGKLRQAPSVDADSDMLYVITDADLLYGINKNGSLLWRVELQKKQFSRTIPKVSANGPDNQVFVIIDERLRVFAADGTWKWSFSWSVNSLPIVGDDGTIYLVTTDGLLIAISPDGDELWRLRLCPGNWRPGVVPGPVLSKDGKIYAVCLTDFVYAVDTTIPEIEWALDLYPKDTTFRIRFGTQPLIGENGNIYLIAENGGIFALNPDGEILWKVYLRDGYQMGDYFGLAPDGQIYITATSSLHSLSAAGEVNWKVPLGRSALNSSPITFGPDGRVFLTTIEGQLLSILPTGEIEWQVASPGREVLWGMPAVDSAGQMYMGMGNQLLSVQLP
jgi:outer membrane protein assembly factor BamB